MEAKTWQESPTCRKTTDLFLLVKRCIAAGRARLGCWARSRPCLLPFSLTRFLVCCASQFLLRGIHSFVPTPIASCCPRLGLMSAQSPCTHRDVSRPHAMSSTSRFQAGQVTRLSRSGQGKGTISSQDQGERARSIISFGAKIYVTLVARRHVCENPFVVFLRRLADWLTRTAH